MTHCVSDVSDPSDYSDRSDISDKKQHGLPPSLKLWRTRKPILREERIYAAEVLLRPVALYGFYKGLAWLVILRYKGRFILI